MWFGEKMNNELIEYIAERVADITRKSPYSRLDITVIMPTTTTEYFPVFAVQETPLISAGDSDPKTFVTIMRA